MNDCGRKKLTSSPPLWRLMGTRKLVGLHTFPFSIKRSLVQLRQDIPLEHKSTIFSVYGSPNKVAILCPNNSSLLIYRPGSCGKQCGSLDSVRTEWVSNCKILGMVPSIVYHLSS